MRITLSLDMFVKKLSDSQVEMVGQAAGRSVALRGSREIRSERNEGPLAHRWDLKPWTCLRSLGKVSERKGLMRALGAGLGTIQGS